MFYTQTFLLGIFFLFQGVTLLLYLLKFKDFVYTSLCLFILAPISMLFSPGFDFSTLVYARLACIVWMFFAICFAGYYYYQRNISKSLKDGHCQAIATALAFMGFAVMAITVIEY